MVLHAATWQEHGISDRRSIASRLSTSPTLTGGGRNEHRSPFGHIFENNHPSRSIGQENHRENYKIDRSRHGCCGFVRRRGNICNRFRIRSDWQAFSLTLTQKEFGGRFVGRFRALRIEIKNYSGRSERAMVPRVGVEPTPYPPTSKRLSEG